MNNNKLKFFLISYENYGSNGRLRELINCIEKIGRLNGVFLSFYNEKINMKKKPACIEVKIGYRLKNPITFFRFILTSFMNVFKNRDADYMVICNTPACIPGFFINKIFHKYEIIYDAYELKLPQNRHKMMEKIFSWFEKKIIKSADIVVCANKERAQIMKEFYNLKTEPIVFENIRKIEVNGTIRTQISELIDKVDGQKINLISTGGYDIQRGADKLILAMRNFQKNMVLYIVGGGTNANKNRVEQIIKEKNLGNVIMVGQMNQTELNALLNKCDVGIVQYHQNDINNKFCASGKIYEYLDKGLAVVTSTNPPLLKFCNKYRVGVSNEDYTKAILEVSTNLKEYKENARKTSKEFNPTENNSNFIATMQKMLRI